MKKGLTSFAVVTAATLTALSSPPVAAYEAGDWLVRGRIISVNPKEDSGRVKAGGAPIPGSSVGLDNDETPEVDFTYMISRNLGLELILASSKHEIKAKGAAIGALGNIFSARTLPPTLTLQYHFMPDSKFQPYAGIGLNYTLFFDEDATSSLKALSGRDSVDLDDSIGVAAQLGMDVALTGNWFMNFDVKYIDMDTTATIKSSAASPLAGAKLKVDVDVDPWIYGIGVGYRF